MLSTKPEFTREQEDWLCYIIDEWYFKWKRQIVPIPTTHNLGYAKEQLKELICMPKERYDIVTNLAQEILNNIANKMDTNSLGKILENNDNAKRGPTSLDENVK